MEGKGEGHSWLIPRQNRMHGTRRKDPAISVWVLHQVCVLPWHYHLRISPPPSRSDPDPICNFAICFLRCSSERCP